MASPLLGYNTNVRHLGKLYHIQTEDSGVKYPHIMTHLFADGGRIIASKKTSYGDIVGTDDMKDRVKQMMRDQHKAMFIDLRDGVHDEDGEKAEPTQKVPTPPLDVDALEAAAAKLSQQPEPAPVTPVVTPDKPTSGRYQQTRATRPAEKLRSSTSAPPGSIFGSDLLSEKSLDEVILSYLAEDLDDED